jgi:AraC-like DNA-binding protein
MNMSPSPSVDLHIRSYGQDREPDRHDFAQLVLPLRGAVLLEIEGRQGRLDPLHMAFVEPGAWHSQCGDELNRSIIVDIDLATVAPPISERLQDRPFTQVGPAARKLIEFMGIMADQQAAQTTVINGWMPLLLDALAQGAARPISRLAALQARIEAEPGLPWTTESMAKAAGVSVSRLHALFRTELDASPHGWLLELRLARVREWLARTERPIADLALCAGFSDQSALTRAMRNATGMTPAAYRRQSRENRPK